VIEYKSYRLVIAEKRGVGLKLITNKEKFTNMKNSKRINTLFVAIGTNPFDSLLQAIDTPSFYDALIKNSFNRIVFQCPK